MTQPTTQNTIRFSLIRELVLRLRNSPDLNGVLIEPGWPGQENLRSDSIWVDDIAGQLSYPFSEAGRKTLDDRFEVPFVVRVLDQTSLDATHDRLGEIFDAVHDVLADDPALTDANGDSFAGLMHCLISEEKSSVGQTPDGPVGWAQIVVQPYARYVPTP